MMELHIFFCKYAARDLDASVYESLFFLGHNTPRSNNTCSSCEGGKINKLRCWESYVFLVFGALN